MLSRSSPCYWSKESRVKQDATFHGAGELVSSSLRGRSLVDYLRFWAKVEPERRAFVFLDDQNLRERIITYGFLNNEAQAIGAGLISQGLRGQPVLLCFSPGLAFITALMGCLVGGAIPVPLFPPTGRRRLNRLVSVARDSKACLALTSSDENLEKICKFLKKEAAHLTLRADTITHLRTKKASHCSFPQCDPEEPALLQYTSGTTGSPKGVVITHNNLLANVQDIGIGLGTTRSDIGLNWLPLYHDMGLIGSIFHALFRGLVSILMAPEVFIRNPYLWIRSIANHRATLAGGPNFAFDLISRKITAGQLKDLDLSCWRIAFCGAEPVRADTLRRLGSHLAGTGFDPGSVYPCYGMAEATLLVSGGDWRSPPVVLSFDREALARGKAQALNGTGAESIELVGCGWVFPGSDLVIADPATGEALPEGRVGEVWVSGPGVATSYWQDDKGSRQTFGGYLKPHGPGPFLRTGDLGFRWEKNLFITGRSKEVIIVRGRNYYCQDIEISVEDCHGALEPGACAAFSVEHREEECLVIAHEVRRDHLRRLAPAAIFDAVRKAVSTRLGLIAHTVVLLRPGGLPRTSSGKIQKIACRRDFLGGTLPKVARDPVVLDDKSKSDHRRMPPWPTGGSLPAVERHLYQLAAIVLGRAINPLTNQTFAAMGLDSMAAVEFSHVLEEQTGMVCPAHELLEETTPAELAEKLLANGDSSPSNASADLREESGEKDSEFPLSYNQKALWFLYLLNPQSAAYHISAAVSLPVEPLQVQLRELVQSLVDRHPSLGAGLLLREGKPFHRIEHRFDFEEFDVSGISRKNIEDLLDRQSRIPFVLEKDPLLRVRVYRGHQGGPILQMTLHHLVADFWSMGILIKQLVQGLKSGSMDATSDQKSNNYRRFVRFQKKTMAGPRGEALWNYWKSQLSGKLSSLALPTDRPRPNRQSDRGNTYYFSLKPNLCQGITGWAETQKTTRFAVLLSGFKALLFRLTGQDDLMVGTPDSGRLRPADKNTVGYFVNPLVLRTRIRSRESFSGFSGRVRKTVLGALAHREFPFQLLVERLRPDRDASSSPLFQTMIVLLRSHPFPDLSPLIFGRSGIQTKLDGLEVVPWSINRRAAQFDVTLFLVEGAGGISAAFEFNTDLFDVATIARWASYFQTLMTSFMENPAISLIQAPMLPAIEREQLLYKWNHTDKKVPGPLTIHRLIQRSFDGQPDAVATVCGGVALTYAAIHGRSAWVAQWLKGRGCRPGMLVGVCLQRSHEMVAGLLGILKAGAAYVPLDRDFPTARLVTIFKETGIRWVLTDRDTEKRLPSMDFISLRMDCIPTDNQPDRPPENATDIGQLAYIIFTSGSTGRPKGVMVRHDPVVNLIHWVNRKFLVQPGDRLLFITSLCFDLSVYDIFGILAAGGTVDIARSSDLDDPERLVSMMQTRAITFWDSAPAALTRLTPFLPPAGKGSGALRLVFLSGDWIPLTLPPLLQAAFGSVQVVGLGGATEATVWVQFFPRWKN